MAYNARTGVFSLDPEDPRLDDEIERARRYVADYMADGGCTCPVHPTAHVHAPGAYAALNEDGIIVYLGG